MGLLLAFVASYAGLLLFGVLYDRRSRRLGHRVRDTERLLVAFRNNRRDIKAWERGSAGNLGQDISWMSHRRRT
ncbi:hypothetical protein [Actinomadura oligospora]|uniref:hypothetical protein n=1 Tax=Actinomadura oligospora TaxID=111804 RepID=UPI0004793708|nr:hypothetical protein [Actinomadura oligospora]